MEAPSEPPPPEAHPNYGRSYANAYRERHGAAAPGPSIKRVAKDAKALEREGRDPDLIEEAVRRTAASGHANLPSMLTRMLAEDTATAPWEKPPADQSALPAEWAGNGWTIRHDGAWVSPSGTVTGPFGEPFAPTSNYR